MKKIHTLLLCFIAAITLQAQPDSIQRYGCHYMKRDAHCEPLTAQKKAAIFASNSRSDSFDIIHYDIKIDISSPASKKLKGTCTVLFSPKIPDLSTITLDLLGLAVDSIKNATGENLLFSHQGISLVITLPAPMAVGETGSLTVWYQGTPIQSPSDFGGVYFEGNYIYNLSIGLTDDPHNFGHAWFPCFDNFVERSSFEMSFLTTLPYRTYATGDFLVEIPGPDSQKVWRTYRLDVPSCTYHVSFAAADYGHLVRQHTGLTGEEYPMEVLAHHADTTRAKNACFNYLNKALDCFEYWFGPYPYNKVGYALATRGAMENPGNTIYPDFLIDPVNNASNISILTHELAHQWWGNVVTVGSESDMWVKEGNAEYGAHLFIEHYFGKTDFITLEKQNNVDMLFSAHYDDGAFLPLSPMPHEVTYGTTTYNKGAMTMHNMRYYLGDSLFRTGMTHLQTALRYEAMDAYEMRDSLTAYTGVDLTNFFDDWIFNPGWSDFALDSCVVKPLGNGNFEAAVAVRQGLRASTHFHHNVPLEVNFRKADGSFESRRMIAAGEKGAATFILPFEPQFCMLNRNQELNLAHVNYDKVVKTTGSVSGTNTSFSINVKNVPAGDSAFVLIQHHWSAPEVTPDLPSTVKISSRHYWNINGIWPDGFIGNGIIRYDRGTTNAELDADLLATIPEDSLIVLYRKEAGHEWIRYPRAVVLAVGSMTDGLGVIRLDTMIRGEYALATGYMDFPVNTTLPETTGIAVDVSPNPTTGDLQMVVKNTPDQVCSLALYTLWGTQVRFETISSLGGNGFAAWKINDLPAGVYLLQVQDKFGKMMWVEKVIKS
jgi:hypothetical protein